MSRPLLAALSTIMIAGCSVIGVRSGTEEPRYRVVDHVGDIEIREYGPRIAAETTIDADETAARSAGFRRLASYIFGANKGNAKIAMTAPVSQSPTTIAMTAPVSQSRDSAGRWVIRFYMPADSTMATLPTPNDSSVRLTEVAPETMGVLRFTGFAGAEAVAERRQALLASLRDGTWSPNGPPTTWFYDPPWTLPFLRRNEVAVPVSHR
jgi:hypothetical protein